MSERVVVSYIKTVMLDFEDLTPFQGNLKELHRSEYDKLKNEILESGFAQPFSVWIKGKKNNILDGHQRWKTMKAMRGEGIEIPKLPCNVVDCKNEAQAKRMVLALTSQYGVMTGEGLYEFQQKAGISFDELKDRYRLPDINMDKFEKEFLIEAQFSEKGQPEFPIIPEFSEKYDYVVVLCKTEIDYLQLQTVLGIERKASYKSTAIGKGRVIWFDDFIKKVRQ